MVGSREEQHTKGAISCLHIAQTDDIWLKPALKGKTGLSLQELLV